MLTLGGGNKKLVGGVYRRREMVKFLKHIVQKHNQMNIRNLLNG